MRLRKQSLYAKNMGVPGLIGVLERACGEVKGAKRVINMKQLQELCAEMGRSVIAVDAMNILFYLAGHEGSRGLEVELDHFCGLLRRHELKAACIFDSSRMSKQRKERAADRRQQRTAALSELQDMKKDKGFVPFAARKRHALLRSRTIHVDAEQVRAAQHRLSSSGVCTVFMAPDEADSVCVDWVDNGHAFGCVSNDSDMFVRGCRYVLRKYEPHAGTFELWDTECVYASLNLNEEQFRNVCQHSPSKVRRSHDELHSALTAFRDGELETEWTWRRRTPVRA